MSSEFDHLLDKPEKSRRRRRWWVIASMGLLSIMLLGIGGAAGTLWYFSQDLPSLEPLQNYQPSLVTRVYSDDRQVIGQFFIERRFLKPLQVSQPEVILHRDGDQVTEPYEELTIQVPSEYQGPVIEEIGKRRGELRHMKLVHSEGTASEMHIEYHIPTRGIIGLKNILLAKTRGTVHPD